MKAFAGVGIVVALTFLSVAAISCSKDKTANKPSVMQPSEESKKKAEAFLQSVSGSKKTIVAKVNGVDISMFDLINEMNTVAPQYIKPGQKSTPEIDKQVRKNAIDRLIYRELAVQEAVRQGMTVPPDRIDQQIKKMKADLKSEDAYNQRLASMGITEPELRKQFERAFLVEMITEKEIFDKVKIDPNMVRKTYERDKASYRGPSGQMSFEEAKPAIEEKLMAPLVQKKEDEWVDKMKKSAKIEITLGEAGKGIQSVQ